MLRRNFHSCATFSKKILGRVSPRPAENKTRGLVGLEDSTAPYDSTCGHLQQAPSIVIRAGSIVAQTPPVSRNHRCASSEMLIMRLIPPMLRKNFHSCATFSKRILGRVSPRPPENKSGGLVGLEDSTAPYDTRFGHLQGRPSIVIQTDSIVAQTLSMSLTHRCASSEMLKMPYFSPMLCKNFHSCATFSKKILRRIYPQPPENKTGGLVGLEDSTAPYDSTCGHLQQTPSIVIRTDSMVAQTPTVSRNRSCASSANVAQTY